MKPAPIENVPKAAASSSHSRVLESGFRSDMAQACLSGGGLPSPGADPGRGSGAAGLTQCRYGPD